MIEEMKVDWDPTKSETADIFENTIARNLWVQYKRSHIISQNGLPFLNEVCRELITENAKFNEEEARSFLDGFMKDMAHVEHSMSDDTIGWVDKTIPFMTGESEIKLVFVNE